MNADDPVMRAFGGAFLNHPGLRSLDRRVAPPVWTVTPVPLADAWDAGYNAGKNDLRDGRTFATRNPYLTDAECVCEEPCRYCQCEVKP